MRSQPPDGRQSDGARALSQPRPARPYRLQGGTTRFARAYAMS